KGGGSKKHTAVGSYTPNAWGLYDMHGNVWEVCLDWQDDLSGGVIDPKGADSGLGRVVCGGCWSEKADDCTSSSQYSYTPAFGSASYGFRLVRTVEK
ncbi:MAG: SUMF1/EgtB/PvdO family nonheme iron enzyme, partial [Kiritimatiellae bacterium]|nr:SUMF1/EgtB/PvdO family nonheme iron enzyme [Kiritimatiellia bacterium]